jgi:pimeloyl-ACP methyl ester carboxylesterase
VGALLLLAQPGAAGTAAPPPGHFVAVRGIRMYVEETGHGRPLLLLHGGAGSGAQFAAQVPFFARRFRVIVPDACAQGRTSDRPGPLSYHEMAEDVVALLDSLHVRRADVVGWSDGGVVGLDLAIHHPDRLRRLVTFGANFRPDGLNPSDVAWADSATVADFGPDMRRFYVSVAPDSTHYEAAMQKILDLWRSQPNFTLEQLGRIRTPTLIAAGEHDVVRREHTDALARAIPGAREWIVPGASHSVLQEEPAVANPRILEFLGP